MPEDITSKALLLIFTAAIIFFYTLFESLTRTLCETYKKAKDQKVKEILALTIKTVLILITAFFLLIYLLAAETLLSRKTKV